MIIHSNSQWLMMKIFFELSWQSPRVIMGLIISSMRFGCNLQNMSTSWNEKNFFNKFNSSLYGEIIRIVIWNAQTPSNNVTSRNGPQKGKIRAIKSGESMARTLSPMIIKMWMIGNWSTRNRKILNLRLGIITRKKIMKYYFFTWTQIL